VVEIAGYIAAALVLATFCMRTMMPLRLTAIASNVAFIAYGALGGLTPILLLHGVLLPLNIWRLIEMRRLVREAREVSSGGLSMYWLLPYLKTQSVAAGTVLFRRGDEADRLYIVMKGAVLIEGVGVTLGKGAVFGEIAMFSGDGRRSQTARCTEASELVWMDRTELALLFQHHPALAFHLIRIAIGRLLDNEARLQAEIAALTRRDAG
jgi:hypothetical protein